MPSIKIGQFWQGVTGQPPWLAQDGQVEDSVNFRNDISVGGVAKRQAMLHVAELTAATATKLYKFVTLRNYLFAIGASQVLCWNTDTGAAVTVYHVTFSNNTYDSTANPPTRGYDTTNGVPASSFGYLSTITVPDTQIRVAVSQDTIIVTNTLTTTAMITGAAGETGPWGILQAYQYIRDDDTEALASDVGPVSTYSDLTASPTEGDYAYVEIGENLDPAGTYIFSALGYGGTGRAEAEKIFPAHGKWYRIIDSVTSNPDSTIDRFNPTTMPHRIILDEANSRVIWDVCPWKLRMSGNSGSNPNPKFIGEKIKTVEFLSGRLFLISDKVVRSGRGDDFFNLFVDIIDQITDRDYASINITQSGIGNVLSSSVLIDAIFLATQNAQLQFRPPPDETLTNKNGKLTTITTYQTTTTDIASSHNFAVIIDSFDDVHLYAWVDGDRGIQYLSRLTIHYPEALYDFTPNRISFVDNTIYIATSEGDMLIHDLLVLGGQLVQTAWGRYVTFEPITYMSSWGGEMLAVSQDGTLKHSLLTYQHRDIKPSSGLLYQPYMDRMELVESADMTFDEDTDLTVVPHTSRDGSLTQSFILRTDDPDKHTFQLAKSLDAGDDPQFAGDLTGASQWLGFRYTCNLDLIGLIPMSLKSIKIKQLGIGVHKSSDVELHLFNESTVNPPASRDPDHKMTWQAPRYGVDDYGTGRISTEIARMSVNAHTKDMLLRIYSESLGPVIVTAIDYDISEVGSGSR